MKFVQLTEPSGQPVYIKADSISRIAEQDGRTVLFTSTGQQAVKETIAQVIQALQSEN